MVAHPEIMIRPYQPEDEPELLNLLRLNTPAYFAPAEEPDFIEYLATDAQDYFVVEREGKIIGSGGINYFIDEAVARLSWDMVHPQFQGQGVGRDLTLYRIREIKERPAIHTIVVRTSQLVYTFYERLGFRLQKTAKDFWAPGFDLYQLQLDI